MQDIDSLVRSCVFLSRDAFQIYEDIFSSLFKLSHRQLHWPWQSSFVLFFFFTVTLAAVVVCFPAMQLKLKPSEHQRMRFKGSRRMQVTLPPPTILLTLCLTLSWPPSYFLSRLLSNRCSIFTRKSSRGIRRRTGAKWSDRSTYLCCLRSPWPLILLEVDIYVGLVHRSNRGGERRWGRQGGEGKVWELKSRRCWWQSRGNNLKVWRQQMMR